MKWLSRLAWSVLVAVPPVAAGCVLAGYYLVGAQGALPGTVLEDHAYWPDRHGSPAAWLDQRRIQLGKRLAFVQTPNDVQEYEQADLGIELDTKELLTELNHDAKSGRYYARLGRALSARRGQLEKPAVFRFDREVARAALEELAPHVSQAPINAKLDLRNHARVESQVGYELDIESTLDEIEHADTSDPVVIQARTLRIDPEVTTDMILDIDVSKVLASYETSFVNKAGARRLNIQRAADYLDGTVIPAGGELSFNKVVGPRELERGFVEAPVIINDEMEKGIGGGVCQVATTLHAAAVYGFLDVTRRRSHSRPSGYAPLGLDATVIYPEVDLRIRNPYDAPLIVHAFLPSRYAIRVELLGRDPSGEVSHEYAVSERYDFVRRVVSKPFMEVGEQKRHQKGGYGYDVVSIVRLSKPDGSVSKHTYKSKYYPVPEVYWVSEGSDLSELPALPEGATHTEHEDDAAAPLTGDVTGEEPTLNG